VLKRENTVKKREQIAIPKYSLAEELINSISHGFGAIFGVAALVLCIIVSVINESLVSLLCGITYGVSLIIMYSMSTLYHALKINKAKRVFRVLDHNGILLLIAGTYTPILLCALVKESPVTAWVMFGVVWVAAVVMIVLNSIDLKKYKAASMICYLMTGWEIILAFPSLISVVEPTGIALLVWGGIAYTVGAVIFGIGKKVKYMHSVWHFFVLAGSVLHFFSILFYIL